MVRAVYPGFEPIIDSAGNAVPAAPFDVFDDLVAGDPVVDMMQIDGVTPPDANGGGQFLALPSGIPPHLRGPDVEKPGRLYRDTGSGQRQPMDPDEQLEALLQSGALLNVEQTFTAVQHLDGGLTVPDGALTTSGVAGLDQAIATAAGEGLLAQQQVVTLAVRSVNSVGPDTNGDVVVAGGGGGGGSVVSVEGHLPDGSGDVQLTKVDVGLGNVDDTSDANKPVSTATATALAAKAADTEISTVNISSITSTVRNLISGRRLWEGLVAFLILLGYRVELFYNGTTWPALSTVPAAYIATGAFIKWNSEDYTGAPEPSEAREADRWIKKA